MTLVECVPNSNLCLNTDSIDAAWMFGASGGDLSYDAIGSLGLSTLVRSHIQRMVQRMDVVTSDNREIQFE